MTTIEKLPTPLMLLGENPLWDERRQWLYWIDAPGQTLYRARADGSALSHWVFEEEIGSLVLRENGGGVIALGGKLALIDLDTGEIEPFLTLEEGVADVRLNDAKVSPSGELVIGSMDRGFYQSTAPIEDRTARGGVFSVRPDRHFTRIGEGYAVFNGPCWSPDGSRYYHSDTLRSIAYTADWDSKAGAPGELQPFLTEGMPDGATIDSKGYHWAAFLGAGEIRRHSPDGTLDRTISVPERLVTSVTFGGPALATLYVTTASNTPFPGGEPGGALYAIRDTGVTGLPATRFTG